MKFLESKNLSLSKDTIPPEKIINFVSCLMGNRSLASKDRERIVELLLKDRDKEYVTKEQLEKLLKIKENGVIKEKKKKENREHNPKFTAEFLSLFNRRDGFKYLTHNYDNSGLTLKDMLSQVRKIFENYSYEKRLPGSLRYLMNRFINGGEWTDFEGKKHTEGYSSESWVKWSEMNDNMHPIMDIDGIEKNIQRFRHTIRVVAPDLLNIIESIIQKFPTFNFDLDGQSLGKADFYTNVFILRLGLFGLIKDMTDHKDHKNIKIKCKLEFDGDYFIRQIIITQIGSFSQKTINDVVEKFKSEGGFFSENAEKLAGYCNWSVESLWDGDPYRWNILKDENTQELESIGKDKVVGFSHVLTFYYKD